MKTPKFRNILLLVLLFPLISEGKELTSEQASQRFNLKRDFVLFIAQWEKKHYRNHSSVSFNAKRSVLQLYDSRGLLLEEGGVTQNDNNRYVRNGAWIRYYPDGSVAAQYNYSENLKDGRATGYYPNGKIALRCTYHKGVYTGKRIRYDSSGRLLDSVNFSSTPPHYDIHLVLVPSFQCPPDIPSGAVYDSIHQVWVKRDEGNNFITMWYLNGEPFCEINGKNVGTPKEKLHGRAIYWYTSGKVWMEGRYNMGKPAGTWKIYTEDGTLKEESAPETSVPGQDTINNTILP